MKKKYDLIFSMGAACSCSSALRSAELQVASYPFDWLFGSDFCNRANIVVNDFERFLDKIGIIGNCRFIAFGIICVFQQLVSFKQRYFCKTVQTRGIIRKAVE